jgi:uncharacterized membrane protein (Fun14 family)
MYAFMHEKLPKCGHKNLYQVLKLILHYFKTNCYALRFTTGNLCLMLICFFLVTMFELDQNKVFELDQNKVFELNQGVRNGTCKGTSSA